MKTPVEHDHSGPDWQCEACKPLADVLRARMRWASMHWGALHDDAFPSLARAIHEAGYGLTNPTAAAALESLSADLYRDHDMPPRKDTRSYGFRMGWWEGVHHAAKIAKDRAKELNRG